MLFAAGRVEVDVLRRTHPQSNGVVAPPLLPVQARGHSGRVLLLSFFQFLGFGSAHQATLDTLTFTIWSPGVASQVGRVGP